MGTKIYIEFETFICDISALYLSYKYNIYKMNMSTYNVLKKDGVNDPVLNDFIEKQKELFYCIKDIIEDDYQKESYQEKFDNKSLTYEDFIFVTSYMNPSSRKILHDGLVDDFFSNYIKESRDFIEFMGDNIYIKFIKETMRNIRPGIDITAHVFLSTDNPIYRKLYDTYYNLAHKFSSTFMYMKYDDVVKSVRANLNADIDEYVDLTLASNNIELIKQCVVDLTPKGLSRLKLLHRLTDEFNYHSSTNEYKAVQNKLDISQIFVTV